MKLPFSDHLCEIADDMGVSMFQRFTPTEASLFLRCPLPEIEKLKSRHKIQYVQVTKDQYEFFGFQLLQYLLANISDKALSTSTLASQPPQAERIIRQTEVEKMVGLSRTTIWRKERAGEFPARLPLTSGSIGWRLSEIEEWIKSR